MNSDLDRDMDIAIIGAGIGGLVLTLALRQHGIAAELFEQSSELSEIGAAVALSANATREFERLGLLAEVAAASTEPTELIWRDGRSGRRVAAHPVRVGAGYRQRFGAPYLGIHRASLQKVLGRAVGREPINLGHRLAGISAAGSRMKLAFENGVTRDTDLVVGADGVRSVVRRWINGNAGTRYSRTSAFRGIVPRSRLPSLPDPEAIQFWMGPNAHLLHYAIGQEARDINFFAVVEGPDEWADDHWIAVAGPGEAVAAFRGWHPAVTEMVGAGWIDKRWGLFVVEPRQWWRGGAVLIGDAAHGMLPHQGQGANTTIEDAVTLAGILAQSRRDDLAAASRRYEALRKGRTRAVQRSSWATNRELHLPDGVPALARRDRRLPHFPEEFGWIHAHDATRAIASGTG
jgi:salicylate hydroxylase